MRDTAPPPLTRDAVAAILSEMAFRTIDPDLSLNIDCGIYGDEAQSLLERTCTIYGVDIDLFWSKVDSRSKVDSCSYFEPETNWATFPIWVLWFVLSAVMSPFWKPKAREDVQGPFTVDLLVQILEACRGEGRTPLDPETSEGANPPVPTR